MVVAISKVTQQGQISIPATVRKRLGIRPGHSRIVWDVDSEGRVIIKAEHATADDLHRVIGRPKARLSSKELLRARVEYWNRRADEVSRFKR